MCGPSAVLARLAGGAPQRDAADGGGVSRQTRGGCCWIGDGRELIDFSSNDYLGLARHPALAAAMGACAARTGAGSGASHLITGHGVEHARLEEELAAFTRARAGAAVLHRLHGQPGRDDGARRRAGSRYCSIA